MSELPVVETIDDALQVAAEYLFWAEPLSRHVAYNPDSALGRYWRSHPELGPLGSPEFQLADGTAAMVFPTGAVLQWFGGDDVRRIR